MYKLQAQNNKTEAELNEVARLFFFDTDEQIDISHASHIEDGNLYVKITVNERKFECEYMFDEEYLSEKQISKLNKLSMYKALSGFTGRSLPWGSLTGVRPTKLAYELLRENGDIKAAVAQLRDVFMVSDEKAKLTEEILNVQRGYYGFDEHAVNLYVHIPFCVSKCSYCSFITDILTPKYPYVKDYVGALIKEIRSTVDFLTEKGYRIASVYVGGGTPTALDSDSLARVLQAAYCGKVEYTCEAGRPDTITEEKLEVMARYGVTRVCINPQSLCDETLNRIGRRHSADDFYAAFNHARRFGFDINTDLIAGLEGESCDTFCRTVESIVSLKPENVTVHTLSRKNGSQLIQSGKKCDIDYYAEVGRMVENSHRMLSAAGYLPYYTYRQKRMVGNLENTGYCLPNKQCFNNITTMEECLSVAACGAGAIGKRLRGNPLKIEREANLRNVRLYLEQFEDRLAKKLIFLA